MPTVGTTGSGIYSGKSGALTALMTGENTTKLLVHEVPKIPGDPVEISSPTFSGSNFDHLKLYRDELDDYTFRVVYTNNTSTQSFDLCSTFKEEHFCCSFLIASAAKNITSGSVR